MARLFSIKPSTTSKGRKFKGIRGSRGSRSTPTHRPRNRRLRLRNVLRRPVLDPRVRPAGPRALRCGQLPSLLAGAIASLPTALTGFWDWLKSTEKHTQAWRTANWHMAVMLTVTVIVIVDLLVRSGDWSTAASTPTSVAILSLVVGLLGFIRRDLWRIARIRLRVQRRTNLTEGSGRRPRKTSFPARDRRDLDREADVQHVSFDDFVVLALDAELALGLRCIPRSGRDQLVVSDDLGSDEASLEIGVDRACGFGSLRAAAHLPGARLVLAGREERDEIESSVASRDDPVQSGLSMPKPARSSAASSGSTPATSDSSGRADRQGLVGEALGHVFAFADVGDDDPRLQGRGGRTL